MQNTEPSVTPCTLPVCPSKTHRQHLELDDTASRTRSGPWTLSMTPWSWIANNEITKTKKKVK